MLMYLNFLNNYVRQNFISKLNILKQTLKEKFIEDISETYAKEEGLVKNEF